MPNTQFLKIAVALLVLLNLGTLAFIGLHRPGPRGPFMFIVQATGMDDEQQQVYAKLRDAHRAKVEGYQAQNSALHGRLFDLLAQHEAGDPLVQPLMDSIAAVKRQEEVLTYEHFKQVRNLCRPDQQPKFDAAIGEAIQSMAPPSRPR